jgi:hypothetical protein
VLELAVAIELVAKEIAETDRLRFDSGENFGQGGFVHLEQAELSRSGIEQRRGDPGDEVRAGAVVRQPEPFAEDGRRHRRGGGLAVRRRDDSRTEREPCSETVDGVRIELPEQLAGDGRTAAGPRKTRQSPRRPRDGNLGGERDRNAQNRRRLPERPPIPRTGEFHGALPLKGEVRHPIPTYGAPGSSTAAKEKDADRRQLE